MSATTATLVALLRRSRRLTDVYGSANTGRSADKSSTGDHHPARCSQTRLIAEATMSPTGLLATEQWMSGLGSRLGLHPRTQVSQARAGSNPTTTVLTAATQVVAFVGVVPMARAHWVALHSDPVPLETLFWVRE
jgi:hypothetical protein